MEEKIKELSQQISEIHKALIGDEYRPEGLVKCVDRHDKTLKKHDRYIWAIVGAYLLAVFLLSFGDKIINLL